MYLVVGINSGSCFFQSTNREKKNDRWFFSSSSSMNKARERTKGECVCLLKEKKSMLVSSLKKSFLRFFETEVASQVSTKLSIKDIAMPEISLRSLFNTNRRHRSDSFVDKRYFRHGKNTNDSEPVVEIDEYVSIDICMIERVTTNRSNVVFTSDRLILTSHWIVVEKFITARLSLGTTTVM